MSKEAREALLRLYDCSDYSDTNWYLEGINPTGDKTKALEALDRLDELKSSTGFNLRLLELDVAKERIAELIPRQTDLEEENSQLKQDLTKSRQQVERLLKVLPLWAHPNGIKNAQHGFNPQFVKRRNAWEKWLDKQEDKT